MFTMNSVRTARHVSDRLRATTLTAAVAASVLAVVANARECGDHAGIRNRRIQQRVSTASR